MRRTTRSVFSPRSWPHWPGEASVDGATVRVLGGPGANNGFCLPATTTAAAMTITAVGHYCRTPRIVRYWFQSRFGGTEYSIFLSVLRHRRPLTAIPVISFVRRQTVETKWLKTTSGVSMVARHVEMKKPRDNGGTRTSCVHADQNDTVLFYLLYALVPSLFISRPVRFYFHYCDVNADFFFRPLTERREFVA